MVQMYPLIQLPTHSNYLAKQSQVEELWLISGWRILANQESQVKLWFVVRKRVLRLWLLGLLLRG